jgi:hypothetical protein
MFGCSSFVIPWYDISIVPCLENGQPPGLLKHEAIITMASSSFSNKLVKRVIMNVDRSSLVIPWHDGRFVLLSVSCRCLSRELVNQGLLKQGHHMASS